jgi:hypothetical protein
MHISRSARAYTHTHTHTQAHTLAYSLTCARTYTPVLQEEICTLNDTIKSKESEIDWLYKKHGLVRPGSFQAFKATAATKLGVARDKTREGASRASENAVKLWRTASANAKVAGSSIAVRSKSVGSKARSSFSELASKAKARMSNTSTASGGDDMASRYGSG